MAECCLITNNRCIYEIDNNCTAECGGERSLGNALCEIEKLKLKKEKEIITKEGMKEFLKGLNKII